MAFWLARQGHEVRVVTAPPYYPNWHVADDYSPWSYCRETVEAVEVWRCPLFVPNNPSPLKRLLHLFSFALSSFPVMMLQVNWRPDIVFVVEPPLFCAPQALLTAFLARGKSWLHVQDFEVAAFFGLGFAKSSYLERFCLTVERRLMCLFDNVSSISRTMVNRLLRFDIPEEKVCLFPNWVDFKTMIPQAKLKNFRTEWAIPDDCKIVLYSGNMGKKQGLEVVLSAATELARLRPDLLFIMVGDGAAKQELVAAVKQQNLQNVIFKPLQLLSDMSALLGMADLHLVIQKRGVADAVLPSKLTGIFAVGGLALVTADQNTELGQLINDNEGIAMLVEPEDQNALVQAIITVLDDPSLKDRAYNVARNYAENFLDIELVLKRVESRFTLLAERS